MRVLIADDDVTSRLLLRASVTKLGHECLVAEDGSEAWALLGSEAIDVLLTDWMMPGLDGPELCRLVREQPTAHYTYIVLVTGMGQREQVVEGMSAGADDYLIKPADPFVVQTRMIAAERVTAVQRRLHDIQCQLEKANDELLCLSRTDPLTGLGNRRRLEEDLDRVHARAERTARPFGVALFDVDHFKLYNDHYGHLAGDACLREVATLLRECASRPSDLVARLGGEEFALLLPHQAGGQAWQVAQRCLQAIETARIAHAASPVAAHVTASIGAAEWSDGMQDAEALLKAADEALYAAKRQGRRRVELGGSSTPHWT